MNGKRYDFKPERSGDIMPFLYWDGLWLKEVSTEGEDSISCCAHWACMLIGDDDQDHLEALERAFKAQALEHFLSDRFIEYAEFDELFSFEHDERKATK